MTEHKKAGLGKKNMLTASFHAHYACMEHLHICTGPTGPQEKKNNKNKPLKSLSL